VPPKKERAPSERHNIKTSLSLAPLSVDDALDALLKTSPPPAEKPNAKRAKRRKRR
jgi:hypothetical protein